MKATRYLGSRLPVCGCMPGPTWQITQLSVLFQGCGCTYWLKKACNSQVQWCSQNTADARAQHGHTTFARTQAPSSFKPLAVRNAEATRGVWGMLPQNILEFLSFIGRFWGYIRPYRRLELEHFDHAFCYEPARAQRKVTVVLAANTNTLRSGEHTRPRYSEGTDSYTAQLDFNTFVHFLRPIRDWLRYIRHR